MTAAWFPALLLLVLLWATRRAWRRASPAAQRDAGMAAAFARAVDDDHTCECCHRVSAVREMVMLYDDAALVCVPCADLMKLRRSA